MKPSRTTLQVVTGLALILLPLIALGFKLLSLGWMMVMIMFGPVFVLIIGYILQIVIASQGFLSRRALFQTERSRGRATIAAWSTSLAVVVVGIFMPDGGDIGYGSTLQVWLGAYSMSDGVDAMHAATDGLTEIIAWCAGIVWVAAFVWLVVEWIIGLVQRRRAHTSGPAVQAA